MADSGITRPLTGWQRAHVLSAAEYVRDHAEKSPGDAKARAVLAGLLEVLEPTRHLARQYREHRHRPTAAGSMWDQRSGRERRLSDRRQIGVGLPAGGERRRTERRGGHDRRKA